MAVDPVPRLGQDRIVHGRSLAVAERPLRGHGDLHVKDAAHGPPVQRPGQVEKPGTFGGKRRAPAGARGRSLGGSSAAWTSGNPPPRMSPLVPSGRSSSRSGSNDATRAPAASS